MVVACQVMKEISCHSKAQTSSPVIWGFRGVLEAELQGMAGLKIPALLWESQWEGVLP